MVAYQWCVTIAEKLLWIFNMNDFTKDELEELLDAIGWKLGEGQADRLTFPLEVRLKIMIDNYDTERGQE